MQRQVVLGVICVLYGATSVVYDLVTGIPVPGGSAYGNGAFVGFLFGILLLVVGARVLLKSRRASQLQ
jgi:membrane associated rhomboid family serine protease